MGIPSPMCPLVSLDRLFPSGHRVLLMLPSHQKKITLLNKNDEINLKLCFCAKFRPTKQNNPVAILYNITIDTDQYSSRVTSVGLFKENNERCLQKTMIVNQAQSCSEYIIHIEPYDVVNSLDLCVNINLEKPWH